MHVLFQSQIQYLNQEEILEEVLTRVYQAYNAIIQSATTAVFIFVILTFIFITIFAILTILHIFIFTITIFTLIIFFYFLIIHIIPSYINYPPSVTPDLIGVTP